MAETKHAKGSAKISGGASGNKTKDTRTHMCFTKGCPDYGVELPITQDCRCAKRTKIIGAGR